MRYVGTADEQIAKTKKVTLDDVRKFYQQFYGACEGEIVICGQFERAGDRETRQRTLRKLEEPCRVLRMPVTTYRKIEPINRKSRRPTNRTPFSSPA